MRFWDANAAVPLTVNESLSEDMRLLLEDGGLITWLGTRTECVSALARKTREGDIEPTGQAWARVLAAAGTQRRRRAMSADAGADEDSWKKTPALLDRAVEGRVRAVGTSAPRRPCSG